LNSGTCGYTGDSPIMLCAWENDTMKYHNTGFPYCFIITSTEEFKERESYVRLFPNPATTGITIEIVRAAKSFLRFELLDPVGHILITQDLDSPNSFINLEKLKIAPGIYIYRITSPTAILKTDKLTIL
jgi:hypothetical protein